jgi:uncharacterized protein (TIGR02757 family)
MPDLKTTLDAHYRNFPYRAQVARDPVQFVYRYREPGDRELAAFFAAALAYGNVAQILKTLTSLFSLMKEGPYLYVTGFDAARAESLRAFRHRFNDGRDVAGLCMALRTALEEHGTLEDFFLAGHDRASPTIEGGLVRFVEGLTRRVPASLYRGRALPADAGVRFFLTSPARGSTCKRMNLFLRWMVRKGPVDLHAWRRIDSRQLVLPVDTHIARIGRYIGLTRRRTIDWKMALDMTATLRSLDPRDPVRYDFALCHLGIMRGCPAHHDPRKCRECPLEPICLL